MWHKKQKRQEQIQHENCRTFTSKMPSAKACEGNYKKLTDRTAEKLRCDLTDTNIHY